MLVRGSQGASLWQGDGTALEADEAQRRVVHASESRGPYGEDDERDDVVEGGP